MELQIAKVKEQDKAPIWRMLQLYLHDLSPYSREDLNDQGEYNYPYFIQYWYESTRHAYTIRLSKKPVGFAFVNSQNILADSENSIAEFFILKLYRRQGIGRMAAGKIFDQHPGVWEVRILPMNQRAYKFWKEIIAKYSGFTPKEFTKETPEWNGPIFQFNSSKELTGHDRAVPIIPGVSKR